MSVERMFGIRSAREGDVERIADMITAMKVELGSADAPQPERMIAAVRACIGSDTYEGVMAVSVEGFPIGYAGMNLRCAPYAFGAFAQLTELYVRPEWRGVSVGGVLLAYVEDRCRAEGWGHVEINLPKPDTDVFARTDAFYRRHGYATRQLRTSKMIPII